MPYQVLLIADAEGDLQDLYEHIAEFDSLQSAEYVLDRLLELADTLTDDPLRGSIPKELRPLGLNEYRQAFFKPYRVIYRVIGGQVVIYLIVDGRRDMQTLLSLRLIGH
ncbi:MAG: type II toxin-antitoxin system RelE/ParE family toxin [Steroidobacteraceae bacterium]